MGASPVFAQALPGAADAARIPIEKENQRNLLPSVQKTAVPPTVPVSEAPAATRSIAFTLREVEFKGVTVFTPEELRTLYSHYLDRNTTLDIAWLIAGALTERYRSKGYFLSNALVPQQDIKDGHLTIQAIEGHITKVEVQGNHNDSHILQDIISRIKNEKPLRIETLEENLLLLNALPGMSFRSVLAPAESDNTHAGEALLTLIPETRKGSFSVSIDNYGSRYIGPYMATAAYQGSILPLQQTSLYYSMPSDTEELNYISLSHEIPLARAISLQLDGNYTRSEPGFSLEQFNILSTSANLGASLTYDSILRRREVLTFTLAVEARESSSDLLGQIFTEDSIRTVSLSGQYDYTDNFDGSSRYRLDLSQGLDILGASDAGDLNLTRAEAKPDFTKAVFSFSRLQSLPKQFSLLVSTQGQVASGPLYSSEEFGYGGQSFGRAYDPSEITGDHGIAASLEARYNGFRMGEMFTLSPYLFYDIGSVWNEGAGQVEHATGSSAGIGLRSSYKHISTNIGIAQPLTREVSAPQHGNGKNPRFLLQISTDF